MGHKQSSGRKHTQTCCWSVDILASQRPSDQPKAEEISDVKFLPWCFLHLCVASSKKGLWRRVAQLQPLLLFHSERTETTSSGGLSTQLQYLSESIDTRGQILLNYK